jgi:hypothetical protein
MIEDLVTTSLAALALTGLLLLTFTPGWDKRVRRIDNPKQPINFTGSRRI